jgi:hypothetical protein
MKSVLNSAFLMEPDYGDRHVRSLLDRGKNSVERRALTLQK